MNDFAPNFQSVTALPVTDWQALPVTGAADYSGRVRLNLPLAGPSAAFDGDLAVSVTFAGGDALTGRIGDLRGAAGPLAGALHINGGVMHRDSVAARDYQLTAHLDGVLVQGGQSYDLSGQLAGDFHGATGAYLAGVIFQGLVMQGDETDVFDGSFFAQRDASGV